MRDAVLSVSRDQQKTLRKVL